MSTITSLGFSIFSTYDGRGTTQARRSLNDLNADLDRNKAKLKSSASSFFSVSTAAAALGPALFPLGSALLGGAAAFTTMSAAGIGAAGVLGGAVLAAFHGTSAASKKMQADVKGVSTAFQSWGNQVAPMLQGPVHTALTAVSGSFRLFTPLVAKMVPLANQLATAFQHWTQTNLKGWISWIGSNGVPIFANFITAGKNLGRVFGDMLKAFAPMALSMSQGLTVLSAKLKGWADGGGFTRFMNSVRAQGPDIKNFFQALGGAIGNVSKAMAGLGPISLSLTTLLLRLTAAMPIPVLQSLIVLFVACRAAALGLAIIQTVTTYFRLMQAACLLTRIQLAFLTIQQIAYSVATRVATAAQILFNAVMDANPIVLVTLAIIAIIAAIVLLALHWTTVWNAIKATAVTVWAFLTHGLGQLALLLLGPIGILILLGIHWQQVWNAMKVVGIAVWNAMKVAWHATVTTLSNYMVSAGAFIAHVWSMAWTGMRIAGVAIWNAMKVAWHATVTTLSNFMSSAASFMAHVWSVSWKGIEAAGRAIWKALGAAWHATVTTLSNFMSSAMKFMSNVWSAAWGVITKVARSVWSTLGKGFKTMASGIKSTFSGLVSGVKKIWSGIVNVFKTPVNGVIRIWNVVAGAVGLHKIKTLATGGEVDAYADGGKPIRGAGGPRADKVPALLSHGEFVMRASAVNKYGAKTMAQMNRGTFSTGGMVGASPQMFYGDNPVKAAIGGWIPDPIKKGLKAVGGVISDIGGFVKDHVGSIVGAGGNVLAGGLGAIAKSVFGFNVGDVVKPLINAVVGKVPKTLPPGTPQPAGGVAHAGIAALGKKVISFFAEKQKIAVASYSVAGAKSVWAWAPLVAQALAMEHLPQSWLPKILSMMNQESGGNPNAINRTDSNARAGHPSQGLMQTIPSTFAAYHWPGTSNNILDPLANIAAALNYIKHRYGYPPGSPYARGTNRATRGFHLVGENGPEMTWFGGGQRVMNARSTAQLYGAGRYLPSNTAPVAPSASDSTDATPVAVNFHGCTFSGGQRDFETMVVKAVTEAKRKKRL